MINVTVRARNLFRKYRGEVLNSGVSGVWGAFASWVLNRTFAGASFLDHVLVFTAAATLLYLIIFSVSIKRSVTWKVGHLENQFTTIYGPLLDTEYVKRLQHFPREKHVLCTYAAREAIPKLIQDCKQANQDLRKVSIVVDSGTTLTRLFPELKIRGFGKRSKDLDIKIYTNSLSGVEAFNREIESHEVKREQLELIGGVPNDQYRATTGKVAEDFLERLGKENERDPSSIVIAITTSNWILPFSEGGVALCAKGAGHYEFKRELMKIADKVLVVSPLGKLLCYANVEELKAALKSSEYKAAIVEKPRGDVLLATTSRPTNALLYHHWQRIQLGVENQTYTYLGGPRLDLHLTRDDEINVEVPHEYLRSLKDQAFILDTHGDARFRTRLSERSGPNPPSSNPPARKQPTADGAQEPSHMDPP